ncbi:MAG: hypothetical protein QOD01_1584, partial [Actinomycetota bacterium]|nr:hypothetical protein [Actinomycetota bacterium]
LAGTPKSETYGAQPEHEAQEPFLG